MEKDLLRFEPVSSRLKSRHVTTKLEVFVNVINFDNIFLKTNTQASLSYT